MKFNAKLTFYEIQKCGYYKGDRFTFADVQSTLKSLKSWLDDPDLTVRKTQTFTPDGRGNILPVYGYSLTHEPNTGDYLFVTWNESETVQGQSAAVHGDDAPGNAQVDTQDISENSILGFPTYFWFIPEHNLLATVRPDNILNGHRGLTHYLLGFLSRYSRWVVETEESTLANRIIEGYKDPGTQKTHTDVKPHWCSNIARHDGKIADIKTNCHKIRKIIKKDVYKNIVRPLKNKDVCEKLFAFIGINSSNNEPPIDTKYRLELNHRPSETELDQIIEFWKKNGNTQWDDVGFKYEGKSETNWLGGSYRKKEESLDLVRKNDVVFDEQAMLEQLVHARDALITFATQKS